MNLWSTHHPSPLGPLLVSVDERGRLCSIHFDTEAAASGGGEMSAERCRRVTEQLDEYWAGERTRFELDLALVGTDFQCEVWRELQRIPFGSTITYGELAIRVGRPKAVRAVGQANGRNRIPIVVPCHRVIGANGKLTGFAGGLPIKLALLERGGGASLFSAL